MAKIRQEEWKLQLIMKMKNQNQYFANPFLLKNQDLHLDHKPKNALPEADFLHFQSENSDF